MKQNRTEGPRMKQKRTEGPKMKQKHTEGPKMKQKCAVLQDPIGNKFQLLTFMGYPRCDHIFTSSQIFAMFTYFSNFTSTFILLVKFECHT